MNRNRRPSAFNSKMRLEVLLRWFYKSFIEKLGTFVFTTNPDQQTPNLGVSDRVRLHVVFVCSVHSATSAVLAVSYISIRRDINNKSPKVEPFVSSSDGVV